jgi:opacity protein-like surface antigen
MTSQKMIGAFIVLALAGLSTAVPVRAQSADTSEKWQFEITPYFWFSGLKTDIKAGLLPEQESDVSFSDLSKLVDLGLAGMFEGRKGRWGFLIDAMYVDLGKTVTTARGEVDLSLKQSNFSLAGTYRAIEGKAALDLLGGARYTNMTNDLEVTTGPFAGKETSSTDDWVDAFVGARLQVFLAKWLAFVGYGDIGVGGAKISWQAFAGLDVRFSKVFYGKVGYRYSYLDREQDDGFLKLTKAGFYAGLGIRF